MNAGISRCWRYSRSITMPSVRAFSIASSTLPPVPASAESKTQQRRLVGAEVGVREHLVRGGLLEVERGRQLVVLHVDELGGVARLGRACGRRRRRRSRRRRRPGRSASASAPGVTWSGVIGQALMQHAVLVAEVRAGEHGRRRSGTAFAAAVSIEVMVACANGLRTIARCSMPGSVMLSVQRVRPVISRWSSLRRRSRPISFSMASDGRSWVAVMTCTSCRPRAARP